MTKVKKGLVTIKNKLMIFVTTMAVSMTAGIPVYADSTEQKTVDTNINNINNPLIRKLAEFCNSIYADLVIFSTYAFLLTGTICLLSIKFGNEKKAQAGWDWGKRIVVCYIAILSLATIVKSLSAFAL